RPVIPTKHFTAIRVLSRTTSAGTPPKCSKARLRPSRNRSVRLAMVPRPPTDLADRPVFLEVQVSDILLLDHAEHPFWLPPSPRTSGAWVDRGDPLFLHLRLGHFQGSIYRSGTCLWRKTGRSGRNGYFVQGLAHWPCRL